MGRPWERKPRASHTGSIILRSRGGADGDGNGAGGWGEILN